MQTKPLFAALFAAALAFPLAVHAGGDKTSGAKSASTQSSQANGSNDGGADAMFKAMDKNGDGSISKEEAMGTPHHAAFDTLDKNHDGKLSRAEHAAAPEHANAARSESGSASSSSGKKAY